MSYFGSPLTTDPTVLREQAHEDIAAQFPGWEANEGNLEVVVIAALANIIAELRDVASDVPDEIVRTIGSLLHGVVSIDDTPATADVDVVVVDNAGYTLPQGTEMSAALSGSDAIGFVTTEDLTIDPGDTTGTVAVQALTDGTIGNGLTGSLTLLNPLYDWVDSLTFDAASSGGVDAETGDEYLARLVARLQLMAPRPILPRDFAILATDIAGVERAVAIDGFDPSDSSYDNERMVSIAVVDEDGAALSSGVKDEVEAYLDEQREVNFVVHVIDPVTTEIAVTTTFTTLTGFDTAAVEDAVVAALEGYLSPATWGANADSDDAGWTETDTVRYLELAQVINAVSGVDHIETLSFGEEGEAALAEGDNLTLDGPASLTSPGTISATAV